MLTDLPTGISIMNSSPKPPPYPTNYLATIIPVIDPIYFLSLQPTPMLTNISTNASFFEPPFKPSKKNESPRTQKKRVITTPLIYATH
jgi:hypothetical protein